MYNVQTYPLGNPDVKNPTNVPNFWRLGYRQNANELQPLDDIIRKPDAGIFPGRDADGDGIPDDDRNSNGIPDYTEDFLTYYTDPPSFLWGDDWNTMVLLMNRKMTSYPTILMYRISTAIISSPR